MARKRMIDPTIWADDSFGSLSRDAQIILIGMISNADDEGILPANPLYLSSTILPYEEINAKKAEEIRWEIVSKMKSIVLYKIEDKEYIFFKKWKFYQKVDRPQPSKYPPFDDHSTIIREQVPANRIEQNRIEQKVPVDKQRVSSKGVIKLYERLPIEKRLPLHRIAYFLEDTLSTKIVNWGKQASAVDKMLRAGYTEPQICYVIKKMAGEEFYQDKGFDLTTVMNQIALYKAKARKEKA